MKGLAGISGQTVLSLAVAFVIIAGASSPGCDQRRDHGCSRLPSADKGLGGVLGAGDANEPWSLPLNAADCPDGLARCEEGVVFASRLATVPLPCRGPPAGCQCPWDRIATCANGCAADGTELVIEAAKAARQLCAPGPDAGVFASPPVAVPSAKAASPVSPGPGPWPCEEGQRYRCSEGAVVECVTGAVLGRCLRGCYMEGASVDDDDVNREVAFAMLCSR